MDQITDVGDAGGGVKRQWNYWYLQHIIVQLQERAVEVVCTRWWWRGRAGREFIRGIEGGREDGEIIFNKWEVELEWNTIWLIFVHIIFIGLINEKSTLQELQFGFYHLVVLVVDIISFIFQETDLLLFQFQTILHLLCLVFHAEGFLFSTCFWVQDAAPFWFSTVLGVRQVVFVVDPLSNWTCLGGIAVSFFGCLLHLFKIPKPFISYLLCSFLSILDKLFLLMSFLFLFFQTFLNFFSFLLINLRCKILSDMFCKLSHFISFYFALIGLLVG